MRSSTCIGSLVAASVASALVGSLAVALPASADAGHATTCTPSWRTLEPLRGLGDLAEAINRDGIVAGREAGGGPMAIWQPDGSSQIIELDWAEPEVLDLNNGTQVLGRAFAPSGIRRGFVWDAGRFTPLAGTGARHLGRADAINDSGALTGSMQTTGGTTAALWATPSSEPVALPAPDGYARSEGMEIGPRDTITGRAWNPASAGSLDGQDLVIVRWHSGVPRIVDSPEIDTSRQSISFIAGRYFAGVSFEPTAPPFDPSTWTPESGTANKYAPIVVNGADNGGPTGLLRQGIVSGWVVFPDDNQMPTAFLKAPDRDPQVLDDFLNIGELHSFDHLTAVFTNRDGELSVGSCLAPLLEEQ